MSKSKKRRRYTTSEKVEVLKKHHLEKKSVADVCEQSELQPSVFYSWQQKLFANAGAALETSGQPNSREQELEQLVAKLQQKLAKKDSVIAEISAEYVALKKELGEP